MLMLILNPIGKLGVSIDQKDGKLIAKGDPDVVTCMTPLLKRYKEPLLQHLANKSTGHDLRDDFNERAAIHQYDAGYRQNEAELWAKREVLAAYIQTHYPNILAELEAAIAETPLN